MGEQLDIEYRMAQAERRWGCVLKRKNRNEAAGPCPLCSLADKDGFLVFCDGGFWCRQCGATGWVDDDKVKTLSQTEVLTLRVAKLERQQQEHEERLSRLEQMARCQDHLTYHDQMTLERREYWHGEGIFDRAIDQFVLGYARQCPTCHECDSYTIPVFDISRQLVNIRHRLINPNGHGKYRPHMPGLGTHLFNAQTLSESRKRVLILEGEKKSIIYNQHGWHAVGLMGKSFKWNPKWFEWFAPHGEIVIALDPDAEENAWTLGELFAKRGFRQVRVANFATKPDDAIVKYGARFEDIEAILTGSRPVWSRN